MKPHFARAVVGGTFDRFHKGHKDLLDKAFSLSQHVIIGVTTQALLINKKYAATIESFAVREEYIKNYLAAKQLSNRATVIPIDTIYGSTLEDKNIDAIFVTEDTLPAAENINSKRVEKGYSKIDIVTVPFARSIGGKIISSESIRSGEMDRDGFMYRSIFTKTLSLPKSMRHELRKPIGKVTRELKKTLLQNGNTPLLIAVGDIVSFTLAAEGITADISIFDFKTRRHELSLNEQKLLSKISSNGLFCENSAGKVQREAVDKLTQSIKTFNSTGKKQTIMINGEEDLLTLPAILLAPLDSLVIYGLFDTGAVLVQVTEEKKRTITALVKQFIQE